MERLQKIGTVSLHSAQEIPFSRLGIGFEKLDRNVFDPEKAYDKVQRLGVKKVRLQSGWMRTEKEKGVYDFAWLDTIVDNLLRRGLEPWLCLCYGNPVYTKLAVPVFGAVGCPPIGTEEERMAWLAYVRATVEHFRGRISLYEIWNEPNAKYSWRHEEGEEPDFHRNALEYGVFAAETARVIHAADPDAKTIGLAVTTPKDFPFICTALGTGLAAECDYVSYHFYTIAPDRLELVEEFTRLVHSYNPNIGIIQGESGAQSRSDGSGAVKGFAWTPKKQANHLLRILLQDLYAGVEFTSYFSTMDMIEALHGRLAEKASYLDYGYFGVLGADFDENGRSTGEYTEKPSYYALSVLSALMRGDVRREEFPLRQECLPSRRVDGNDCTDLTIRTLRFRLADGSLAAAYWNNLSLLEYTYEGTVTYSYFGPDAAAELIDLRTGDIYAIPENMQERLTNGALRLRNLPLLDVPLLLRFRQKA